MKERLVLFATLAALAVLLTSIPARAQTSSVFATGLISFTRMISAPGGSLLVAEAGNGPNTGRISIVDQNGNRRTLIDGLPSGLNTSAGGADPSGPSGLDLRGRTLYVAIGQGDAVLAGPIPGTEIPNPQPSSRLLSSILTMVLSAPVDSMAGGFTLTPADQMNLNIKPEIVLTNASGESLIIGVVVSFRDFTFEYRPEVPNAVRASNPFGLVVNGRRIYVVDAGQNLVWEVDTNTREYRILASFARKRNPLPFGPPFVDAVPDSIRMFGRQLLVTFLTGFPFAPGQAEVRKINRVNNSQTTFIANLTAALDVLPVARATGQAQFLVLEFSTNMLMQAPGRLLLFDSPAAAPTVVANNLVTPTSIARNNDTEDVFVTELATGRIIRIRPA